MLGAMTWVTDNHAHANPFSGFGFVEVAKRFKRTGGLAMVFAPLLSWHYQVSVRSPIDYERIYEVVVKGVKDASAHLKALAVLGVHPAEVCRLIENFGVEVAYNIAEGSMNLAARYVEQGLAVGLGEVGRPHYTVSSAALSVCNDILDLSLRLAKDLSCPIHLHVERGDESVKSIVEGIRKIGLKPELVVLHHAEPKNIGRCGGLTPSIPHRGRYLEEAFMRKSKSFLVESDFIDDPKRPGAVSYPWAISYKVQEMLKMGIVTEDVIHRVFVENFEKLYNTKIH
ncbi:MAG: TatD family hydrolase [Candidatus Nezhaarchaeota archaeon]|nr:TatD family hydrolase [Candidatus Nezhaarchaeota archaeon]